MVFVLCFYPVECFHMQSIMTHKNFETSALRPFSFLGILSVEENRNERSYLHSIPGCQGEKRG